MLNVAHNSFAKGLKIYEQDIGQLWICVHCVNTVQEGEKTVIKFPKMQVAQNMF